MKAWLGIDLFANPEALLLLLLLPIYLFWYFRFYQRQRLVIRLSYDPSKVQKSRSSLAFLRYLPRAMQLTSIALLIFAIARPQSADEVVEEKVEGIDIMLLLDISVSMEKSDFLPSRLEAAKSNAVSFIRGRSKDRIGLVLFASEAFSYVPLTLDHTLLMRMVRTVNFNMIPKKGTAIGSAIATGLNRIQTNEGAKTKVMVLLTDGANNRGEMDPISAAKLAKEENVRIYCIGMGRGLFEKASEGSQNIPADLDQETLKKIASLTGGKFFHASDPGRLQQIFAEISQLETRKIQNISYRHVQDRYPIFVKIAIILLGMSFLMMLTFVYNPLEQ